MTPLSTQLLRQNPRKQLSLIWLLLFLNTLTPNVSTWPFSSTSKIVPNPTSTHHHYYHPSPTAIISHLHFNDPDWAPCSPLASTMIHVPYIGPSKQQGFALQCINQIACDLCIISGLLFHQSKMQIPWLTRPGSATCLLNTSFATYSLCTRHLTLSLFFSVPRMCPWFPNSGCFPSLRLSSPRCLYDSLLITLPLNSNIISSEMPSVTL